MVPAMRWNLVPPIALGLAACSAKPLVLVEDVGAEPGVAPCADGAGDCIADPETDEIRNGWATVAADPDGGAWVTYARTNGPYVEALMLARSPGAGLPLSAPIEVPVAEPPNVGTTEKPAVAVSRDRIAVAYTGDGVYRHGDAQVLYVQTGTIPVGSADAASVQWDEPQVIDTLVGTDDDFVVEQARVAFTDEGELWVLWKRQDYGVSDFATWAREDDGFVPFLVSPDLSTRHDCSPPDFRFGFSGQALVGLRSNIDGWLQTVAALGDPSSGKDTEITQVSDDTWRYNSEICPEDGPRLAELADGTLYAAWMAPSGVAWRLFSSWSTDGGATWTAPAFDHGGVDLGETWVSVAPSASGLFYTSVESLSRTTRLLTRAHPDDDPVDAPMIGGDGSNLFDVEMASAGGRTVALGMGDERVLWLLELE